MFSWEFTNFLMQQKQPPEVFRKKKFLKILQYAQENICVGASLASLESTFFKYLVSLESTLLKRDSKVNIFLWILQNV